MDKRLFVHIGAPKTGTTYLQSLIWAGRPTWKDAGVFIPGKGQKTHFAAGSDLAGDPGDDYVENVRRERREGAWKRFAGRIVNSQAATVIFSDERLARSEASAAERLAALTTERSIHIVYTVRALDLVLPSAWQTAVKHGASLPFDAWLDAVLGADTSNRHHDQFWRSHDVSVVLDRWQTAFGNVERAHVVTVPRSSADPTTLWSRFASVVGLPPDPPPAEPRRNEALDHAQVELIRRLNERLGESLPPRVRRRLVRNLLATRAMGGIGTGSRATLPSRYAAAVATRTTAIVAAVETRGYDVVGDTADLAPAIATDDAASPDSAAVAAAAEAALEALIRELAQDL